MLQAADFDAFTEMVMRMTPAQKRELLRRSAGVLGRSRLGLMPTFRGRGK